MAKSDKSSDKVNYTIARAEGSGKGGRLTKADCAALAEAFMVGLVEPVQKWQRGEGPKPDRGRVRK